jgi:hypothetical protein
VGFDLKWCSREWRSRLGMERKWRFDGIENEGCVAWKVKMEYYGRLWEDRDVVVLLGRFVDFLCEGTFRLIFSSASRLSAWKYGWRKVQLYERK